MSNIYRYQLDRYRGRSTRYVCPQCHRKGTFTRYIDTYNNNNIYISESVSKCNRIDKCGYHYTPKQYYTDNPWKRDTALVEGGSLRPCGYHYTPKQYYTDNPWKRDDSCSFVHLHRENEQMNMNKPHFTTVDCRELKPSLVNVVNYELLTTHLSKKRSTPQGGH